MTDQTCAPTTAPATQPAKASSTSRRTVLQAGAWSIPAVVTVSAAPAFATSSATLPAGLVVGPLVGGHAPSLLEAAVPEYASMTAPARVSGPTWISGLAVSYQPLARSAGPITVTVTLTLPSDWFAAGPGGAVLAHLRRSDSWAGPELMPVPGAGVSASYEPVVDDINTIRIAVGPGNALPFTATLQPGESTDPLAVLDISNILPDRGRAAGVVTSAGAESVPSALPFLTATERSGDALGPDPRLDLLGVSSEVYVGATAEEIEPALDLVRDFVEAMMAEAPEGIPPEEIDALIEDYLDGAREQFLDEIPGPGLQRISCRVYVEQQPGVTGLRPRTFDLTTALEVPSSWEANGWRFQDVNSLGAAGGVMYAGTHGADGRPTWSPVVGTATTATGEWTTTEHPGTETNQIRRTSLTYEGPVHTGPLNLLATLTVDDGVTSASRQAQSVVTTFMDEVRRSFQVAPAGVTSRSRARGSAQVSERGQKWLDAVQGR